MGSMKTTLELPDELFQRVKLHAVQRRQKLKDAIAQLIELGMAVVTPEAGGWPKAPRPIRLKGRGTLTIDDMEHAIASGRN
jgi:hypothetical protein